MPGVSTGSGSALDPLREVVMNRLAYRNFSNRQVLVGNFSTDVGSDRAGGARVEIRLQPVSRLCTAVGRGDKSACSRSHSWTG